MQSSVTVAPLHIATATIIKGLEQHLAAQRANRERIEELVGEGFDALVAVLTPEQKERVKQYITYTFGPDPEEISKRNEQEAELAALRRKTDAENQDRPLVKLLDFYRAITDKEVEVAPDDAVLHFLPSSEGEESA